MVLTVAILYQVLFFTSLSLVLKTTPPPRNTEMDRPFNLAKKPGQTSKRITLSGVSYMYFIKIKITCPANTETTYKEMCLMYQVQILNQITYKF